MNKLMYCLICISILVSCKAEKQSEIPTIVDGQLNWLSIEQAQTLENPNGKKFLIDVYTDWCGWCKVMDKKTFTDPKVKDYLAENFYVVKFNAEQKETVSFLGEQYEYTKGGRRGVNKLAIKFLSGRLGYPTLVFLDENLEKINAVPGYKKPDQLIEVLKEINSRKTNT